jgi:hypothetical protein
MKKIKTFTSMLLICALMLSSAPLIFGNYVSADTCAANFLPNYYYPAIYVPGVGYVPLDTPAEVTLSENVSDYIVSVLNSKYPIYNPHNESCTANDFYNFIGWLQDYDKAVIYSKGHLEWGTCSPNNYEHISTHLIIPCNTAHFNTRYYKLS